MFLTASSADLGNAILGMIVIGIAIRIAVLIATVSLITWIVKKIWYAGQNRKYKSQNRKWRKFQKKEEKRERQRLAEYEYYQKHQAKKNHKEWQKQQKERKPDPSKGFENNPNWIWDEDTGLWRYKNQSGAYSPSPDPKRYSPTGWFYDEKSGQWIAPNHITEEAKTRWKWDDEKKIWIDLTKTK